MEITREQVIEATAASKTITERGRKLGLCGETLSGSYTDASATVIVPPLMPRPPFHPSAYRHGTFRRISHRRRALPVYRTQHST